MPNTIPGTVIFEPNNPNSRTAIGIVTGGRLRDGFSSALSGRGGTVSNTLAKAMQNDMRVALARDDARKRTDLQDETDARVQNIKDLEDKLTIVIEKADETFGILIADILTLGEVVDDIMEGRASRDKSTELLTIGVLDRLDVLDDAIVQIVDQIKKLHPPTLLDIIFGLFTGQ